MLPTIVLAEKIGLPLTALHFAQYSSYQVHPLSLPALNASLICSAMRPFPIPKKAQKASRYLEIVVLLLYCRTLRDKQQNRKSQQQQCPPPPRGAADRPALLNVPACQAKITLLVLLDFGRVPVFSHRKDKEQNHYGWIWERRLFFT